MRYGGPITKSVIMVLVCLAVSTAGGLSTRSAVGNWYAGLTKPFLTPPPWMFGVVWPVLYCLMGIAAGLIWARGIRTPGVKTALAIFGIQLLLNGLWTPVFFGMHRIDWALADIVLLWLFILVTIILFWKQLPLASVLLWPYLGWVSFAVYLNAGFWYLNR